jgi:hypothetical protein
MALAHIHTNTYTFCVVLTLPQILKKVYKLLAAICCYPHTKMMGFARQKLCDDMQIKIQYVYMTSIFIGQTADDDYDTHIHTCTHSLLHRVKELGKLNLIIVLKF